MQPGSYFVSEQAEMAAKWQMVEDYKSASAKLALLLAELKNIGDEWAGIARVLQGPRGFSFEVEGTKLTVKNELTKANIASLHSSRVSWESLTKLIEDYRNTLKTKDELSSRLKQLGVTLDPYQ